MGRSFSSMPWMNPGLMHASRKDKFTKKYFEHPEDYVILDTETTGLIDPSTRIIELAIIDFNGKLLFHSLFDPQISQPEKIVKITGLTDEMLTGAPLFLTRLDQVLEAIKGKTIVCWNAGFDQAMVENEFNRQKRLMDLNTCKWDCAMRQYSDATDKKDFRFALQKALKEQHVEKTQEHRALGDCLDTLSVLRAFNAEPVDASSEESDSLFGSVNLSACAQSSEASEPKAPAEPACIVVDPSTISDDDLL